MERHGMILSAKWVRLEEAIIPAASGKLPPTSYLTPTAIPDGVIAWIGRNFFDAKEKPLGIPPTVAELHSILGPPTSGVSAMTADQTRLLYGRTTEGMLVEPRKYGQRNAQIYGLHLVGISQVYSFGTCPWDGFAKRRTLFDENSVIDLGC